MKFKRKSVVLPLLCAAPLMQSCTTTPPSVAWSVTPSTQVRHSVESPEAFYQLGRYYQGQNRLDPAVAAFQRALNLDPSHAEARNALGAAFAARGRLDLALAEFERAIAIAPAMAHFHNNLGYALHLQGRHEAAVTAFQRALALDPSSRDAQNNLGLAYAELRMIAKSREAFAAAVEPSATAAVTPSTALALPKDRGVIRQAVPTTPPEVDAELVPRIVAETLVPLPSLELVQLEPSVYELRDRIAPAIVADAAPVSDMPMPTIEVRSLPPAPLLELVQLDAMVYDLRYRVTPTVVPLTAAALPVPRIVAEALAPMPSLELVQLERSVYELRDRIASVIGADATPVSDMPMPTIEVQSLPPALELVQLEPSVYELRQRIAPTVLAASAPNVDTPMPAVEVRPLPIAPALELVQLEASVYELRLRATAPIVAPPPREEAPPRAYRLEVSNGNGVTGLAKRFGRMLAAQGLPKARLTNQRPFRTLTTAIQYREGFKDEADRLSASLPRRPPVETWTGPQVRGDVRLVLGRDLVRVASEDDEGAPIRLARSDSETVPVKRGDDDSPELF